MRNFLAALFLSWALGSAARAEDFHFGEPNGASLGAKIVDGRLIYALKNATDRPWKYMIRMQAQVPMYDNLELVVIDENQVVHHFGFVDSRNACGPIFKVIASGELYQESIDLLDWNHRNAKNKGFSFKEGQSYSVFLHYHWAWREGTAEINYGPLDSKLFGIVFKDGVFSGVKE